MKGINPRAQIVYFEGASHSIHSTAAEAFISAVEEVVMEAERDIK